jgi:hypothetical protein
MSSMRSIIMQTVARIIAGQRWYACQATAEIITAGLIAGINPICG